MINIILIKYLKYRLFEYKNCKSFSYILILNLLGVKLDEGSEPIFEYAFSVFTLSLVGIFSFFSIIGYLISILVLNNRNIENKINSNRISKKLIEYYKKTSLLFVIIEIILCLFVFIILILNSLFILGILVF